VSKPRLKRDWEGRYVRLLRPIETKGGVIFAAGEVMQVTRNFGGLHLRTIGFRCPTCERGFRRGVSKVHESTVSLLPLDWKPDVEEHP
jgi:hypothetical protein